MDSVLHEWMAHTFPGARTRHIHRVVRALAREDKRQLLLHIRQELRGGGSVPHAPSLQHGGYAIDPYSAYATTKAEHVGAWPPAQALQLEQQQQWSQTSTIGKEVLSGTSSQRQHVAQQLTAALAASTAGAQCLASCLSWGGGASCENGRCTRAAEVIARDDQGHLLDTLNDAMRAKIQSMCSDGGVLGGMTASLVRDALGLAAQEPAHRGFICVCGEHAESLRAAYTSVLPTAMKGVALAANAGAAAYLAKKGYDAYTWASTTDEQRKEKETFELLRAKLKTSLGVSSKSQHLKRIADKVSRNPDIMQETVVENDAPNSDQALTKSDIEFLRAEKILLDDEALASGWDTDEYNGKTANEEINRLVQEIDPYQRHPEAEAVTPELASQALAAYAKLSPGDRLQWRTSAAFQNDARLAQALQQTYGAQLRI